MANHLCFLSHSFTRQTAILEGSQLPEVCLFHVLSQELQARGSLLPLFLDRVDVEEVVHLTVVAGQDCGPGLLKVIGESTGYRETLGILGNPCDLPTLHVPSLSIVGTKQNPIGMLILIQSYPMRSQFRPAVETYGSLMMFSHL